MPGERLTGGRWAARMFQSGSSACSRVPPSLRSVPSYSWQTPQFRVALELGSA
ncbi:hypothetical protein M271_13835 [Streptomyces rapamycinicus NRRL 5491]|uniref:hypothetical protein n=1 Tax=Streptomyces rapamycinicus TaxID=1226757 RepID=UPI00038314BE|nr:hypothetical protein M271_13835 [Streptomyces rapamycinicus NRRL 5491]